MWLFRPLIGLNTRATVDTTVALQGLGILITSGFLVIRQNRCQGGRSLPTSRQGRSYLPEAVYGRPVNSDRLLDTSAFFVTHLVKLPRARLPGSQRDSFVARCGRTMTQVGENHNSAPPTPFSFAWTYFSDTALAPITKRS